MTSVGSLWTHNIRVPICKAKKLPIEASYVALLFEQRHSILKDREMLLQSGVYSIIHAPPP